MKFLRFHQEQRKRPDLQNTPGSRRAGWDATGPWLEAGRQGTTRRAKQEGKTDVWAGWADHEPKTGGQSRMESFSRQSWSWARQNKARSWGQLPSGSS